MTRIYRSRKERILAGIGGGLGEMLDVDPTIIRLIMAVLTIMTGIFPMVILYIVGWVIIPEK